MKKSKILVVDDEQRMRKVINDYLTKSGYIVYEACDGEDALDKFFENKDLDLIILDVMMPKLDGWGVCKEIRKESKVPIIMLTAKTDESDELLGFKLGVDEYISKPFSLKILTARVEAILRRCSGIGLEDVIECDGIVMNRQTHVVLIDGVEVEFSFKEFELLAYFLQNEGIALSRENILNNVWNYDYYGEDRTIDTHVKKIRQKLGNKGKYIKTIWGIGYKFETLD